MIVGALSLSNLTKLGGQNGPINFWPCVINQCRAPLNCFVIQNGSQVKLTIVKKDEGTKVIDDWVTANRKTGSLSIR